MLDKTVFYLFQKTACVLRGMLSRFCEVCCSPEKDKKSCREGEIKIPCTAMKTHCQCHLLAGRWGIQELRPVVKVIHRNSRILLTQTFDVEERTCHLKETVAVWKSQSQCSSEAPGSICVINLTFRESQDIEVGRDTWSNPRPRQCYPEEDAHKRSDSFWRFPSRKIHSLSVQPVLVLCHLHREIWM